MILTCTPAGHHFFNARDRLLNRVDHGQGRRLAALHHDDHDGLFAVHQHGVRLRRAGELHIRDVAHIDEGISLSLDRDIVEILDLHRRSVRLDHPVRRLDLLIARRQHDALIPKGFVDITRGEVTGEQFLLIERHQQLHGLTPVWMRQNRSRYLHEQGSDLRDGEVIEVRRCQRVGGDLEHGHRH